MLEKTELNKSILKLADNMFLFRLDETLMWLFNTDTGEYWNLNETSYFVLSLFDGQKSVDEIRQLYIEKNLESGVTRDELLQDLKALMNQFITAKIIM